MNWWFVRKDFATDPEYWEGRDKTTAKVHTYEHLPKEGSWARLNNAQIFKNPGNLNKLNRYRQEWIEENIKFETL